MPEEERIEFLEGRIAFLERLIRSHEEVAQQYGTKLLRALARIEILEKVISDQAGLLGEFDMQRRDALDRVEELERLGREMRWIQGRPIGTKSKYQQARYEEKRLAAEGAFDAALEEKGEVPENDQ